MKLEQEIFKQYVSEDKSRAEICESLGLSENDLKAWIQSMSLKSFKIQRKRFNSYNGIIGKNAKSLYLKQMHMYRSKYGI